MKDSNTQQKYNYIVTIYRVFCVLVYRKYYPFSFFVNGTQKELSKIIIIVILLGLS